MNKFFYATFYIIDVFVIKIAMY